MATVKTKKDDAWLEKITDETWEVTWLDPAITRPHFLIGDQLKFTISASGKKIKNCEHGIKDIQGNLRWHDLKLPGSPLAKSWFVYQDMFVIHFYYGKSSHRHEMIMTFDYSTPSAPLFEYHADSASRKTSHGRGGGGN